MAIVYLQPWVCTNGYKDVTPKWGWVCGGYISPWVYTHCYKDITAMRLSGNQQQLTVLAAMFLFHWCKPMIKMLTGVREKCHKNTVFNTTNKVATVKLQTYGMAVNKRILF